MKTKTNILIAVLMMAATVNVFAQNGKKDKQESSLLKTYLIERDIPGAGNLSAADLKGISQKSCNVLSEMNGIQWVHSYVTGNKIFCVYNAKDESLLREHAQKGGFPITSITEINSVISPETAKQ